jgi:hypothetical protein
MTVTIGRRELLAALGGPAAASPLAGRAQQARPREWFVVCYDGNRLPRRYRRHNDTHVPGPIS